MYKHQYNDSTNDTTHLKLLVAGIGPDIGLKSSSSSAIAAAGSAGSLYLLILDREPIVTVAKHSL